MADKDKQQEKEQDSLDSILASHMQERKKQLYRHSLPAKRTLKEMLALRTQAELDDLCYNLMVEGVSKRTKAELIDVLVPAVEAFAKKWFPTALDEQFAFFTYLAEKEDALSLEVRDDDVHLDYLHAIGLIGCGVKEDKLAWYMPEEVLAVWKSINSGAYRSMVELNTEAARLAAGILYYYGYLDYETLFERVMNYLEEAQREQFTVRDFVGVLLNAASWETVIVPVHDGMKYYTVVDEEVLDHERRKREDLVYAPITYSEAYDAGDPNFILATKAYKDLAQYLVRTCGKSVMEAAFIVGEVGNIFQNDDKLKHVTDYLGDIGVMTEKNAELLKQLILSYHASIPLWRLKGHTLKSLRQKEGAAGSLVPFPNREHRKHKKIGRNDPCPCRSGKKYKHCCLNKEDGHRR